MSASIRELQEDVLVRHWKRTHETGGDGPAGWCARCNWPWPCEDYTGAVETIRMLDEADRPEREVSRGIALSSHYVLVLDRENPSAA